MTRIKKRRSGKKRTADRKKASTGRRGARAVKKELQTKEKKPAAVTAEPAPLAGKKLPRTSGKTRSAGARRVAVSKIVANTNKQNAATRKPGDEKAKPAAGKKTGKGFAPWNKRKPRKTAEE